MSILELVAVEYVAFCQWVQLVPTFSTHYIIDINVQNNTKISQKK